MLIGWSGEIKTPHKLTFVPELVTSKNIHGPRKNSHLRLDSLDPWPKCPLDLVFPLVVVLGTWDFAYDLDGAEGEADSWANNGKGYLVEGERPNGDEIFEVLTKLNNDALFGIKVANSLSQVLSSGILH